MIGIITGIGFLLAVIYAAVCNKKINQLHCQLKDSEKALREVSSRMNSSLSKKEKSSVEKSAFSSSESDEQNKENLKLRQQLEALTKQLQLLQKQEKKDVAVGDQQERIDSLSKKLNQMVQQKKQQEEQQKDLPMDLQKLPQHVLPELARVYRKAQHNEQLLALTRSKLHIAQEKNSELQKRYFSVCRELAMHSSQSEGSNEAPQKQDLKQVEESKKTDAVPVIAEQNKSDTLEKKELNSLKEQESAASHEK